MWDIGLKDIVDILLVAWGMYWVYRRAQSNGTIVLFQGIIAVIVLWLLVTQVLQMRLLGALLDALISVGLIVLVILFQNEIRQGLIRLGSKHQWTVFLKFFEGENQQNADHQWVDQVVLACRNMATQKVGALICIQQSDSLNAVVDTGDQIDALVTSRLIEQVFYKNTPLHDGAMVINGGRIVAAACILPLSHSNRIPKEFGLRHRSALGLSEQTDAKVLIVSEETGLITMAWQGRFYRDLNVNTLQKHLTN